MKFFKNFDNYFTPLLIIALVLMLGSNIFWLFNKQPLTDNLQIRETTSEIIFSVSESYDVQVDENRTHWVTDTYSFESDLNDSRTQAVISVIDEIQSRKRKAPTTGGVGVHGPQINLLVSIDYRVGDQFFNLVMTNERNVMFDLGSNPTSYTLQKGDLEKIAAVIKQHGTKI